jgi:hypothetical protein
MQKPEVMAILGTRNAIVVGILDVVADATDCSGKGVWVGYEFCASVLILLGKSNARSQPTTQHQAK